MGEAAREQDARLGALELSFEQDDRPTLVAVFDTKVRGTIVGPSGAKYVRAKPELIRR